MINRIESIKKIYEGKILEADENIKLLLNNPRIIPEHTDLNKEIDHWLEIKEKNFSKLQHIIAYIPKEEKKDG
tara:strand:+ start:162 stop:380 length:219 start_codon:yes stop_codon:yes gene_type:complete